MNKKRWARVQRIFRQALGRLGSARQTFVEDACRGDESLRELVGSGRGAVGWPAAGYAALGEVDDAFAVLERAGDEPASWDARFFAKVLPWFDPLRGSSRFDAILERLDLPD